MWLLLLSRFSRVRLCATPETAAHQAPPSLGFSRQEHWSGLPFPSPVHESEKGKWSRSVVSDCSDPMDCSPPGSFIHGIFQARVLEWGAIAILPNSSPKWRKPQKCAYQKYINDLLSNSCHHLAVIDILFLPIRGLKCISSDFYLHVPDCYSELEQLLIWLLPKFPILWFVLINCAIFFLYILHAKQILSFITWIAFFHVFMLLLDKQVLNMKVVAFTNLFLVVCAVYLILKIFSYHRFINTTIFL